MPAGHAVTGERVDQYVWAHPCKEVFGRGVGHSRKQRDPTEKEHGAPLAGHQQNDADHGGSQELGAEVANLRHQDRGHVHRAAAMFLHQCRDAPVQSAEVGVADEHCQQQAQAQGTDQHRGPGLAPDAGIDAQAQQRGQADSNHRGLRPEPFGQGQADSGPGRPTGQQVRHCPTHAGQQADTNKARDGHVAHARHHRQHRAQRADKAANQQADNAVLVKVALGAVHPLRMGA